MFLPIYRGWVVVASLVVCLGDLAPHREDPARRLSARRDREPALVQAFGVNVPLLLTLDLCASASALAGFAGVLAAPIYQVSPLMGSNLIIVVFAVVVVGGMGSILGAIVTGYMLGVLEGLTKVFYPRPRTSSIFVIMAIVLLVRPAGLFGRGE